MIEHAASGAPSEHRPDPLEDDDVHDDLLRLIFTCCHPALSPATRLALALRTLCGLSPAQIAGVLLTTEAATAKRLTRARQKIAAAHIPYRVPGKDELADRLPAVCGVIHSLYTAGHAPVDGGAAYDLDACSEAVRLAELLHELLPDHPIPGSVLALLLLTGARRRPGSTSSRNDTVGSDVGRRFSSWPCPHHRRTRPAPDATGLRRTAGAAH